MIYPYQVLSAEDYDITGYFFNDNIHPFTEFKKRLEILKEFTDKIGVKFIADESYNLNSFLKMAVENENNRCETCYFLRLEGTAQKAVADGYDAFSTTLLYSKYQKHEKIVKIAIELSKQYGIDFYYNDFRVGWGRGIKLSKKAGMYRQQYCGCIYSERDRYFKTKVD